MTQKHLSAKRLFEALMFMFVYVALTIAWFGFAAPEMLSSSSAGAVLTGFADLSCGSSAPSASSSTSSTNGTQPRPRKSNHEAIRLPHR